MAGKNLLYYGDNLKVLRLNHISTESVDLVYLDPPFNSDQDYNVLFRDRGTAKDSAQFSAFEDTWRWSREAEEAFHEATTSGGPAATALVSLRGFLRQSDMMAYLSMMAPRLVELRRVLKPTGSIYLHCDPNASHYLKMLMDAVFGPANFRNEIIWKRTGAHNSAKRYGPAHDVLLFYSKTSTFVWNPQLSAYSEQYLKKFRKIDPVTSKPFREVTLTGPGVRKGDSGVTWGGWNVTAKGRHWQPATYVYTKYRQLTGVELNTFPLLKRLDELDRVGMIYWPKKEGGEPCYKFFLQDAPGVPLQDVWTDIDALNSQAAERLGYPTQKPEQLLERIIGASTVEGDTVLDPFCGCGTTVAVAHKMNRRWIGIDITSIATNVIKHRLLTAFGARVGDAYKVVGEPEDVAGAEQLATEDRHQFEHWALGLVGARASAKKKGADQGIDGRLFFYDDHGNAKQIIVSVKSGKTSSKDVRDLRGVIEREKATLGVLITLQNSTQPMRTEAAAAGLYESPWGGTHARLQVLTVGELLEGADIDRPPTKALNAPKKVKEPTIAPAPLFEHQRVAAAPKASQPGQPLPLVAGDRKPARKAPTTTPLPVRKVKRR